ncbi:efflux RND transporter periplasmic adaptor subunit [Ferrovum sp. PN-J185]|uniref:efflux RND transporter periplasmic adaptor subunit n=1 Tax=Ferrovum sp. PN-J185 TaxID=1356306 RepID=UPI000793EA02|nr:efflux RND transporter periplasmic adaptor subunit [Ferrovum sp. PN-J185]KXW55335.1 multidrug resistance protein MdtE precursor [Ferrovum sp. PN-J185]MCC6068489.1 efflux RND transporter periplasmic adaptor subunit [Ferrovum sp. PN-J185]MDE1892535.1 efflux RND transporter periplasmic adaptor subunit [Betaproteobacteria bacterium]MDE2056882.1 efflux RND transporter periplasmic adaptor subunit [Betaproteobacteria bacterium]
MQKFNKIRGLAFLSCLFLSFSVLADTQNHNNNGTSLNPFDAQIESVNHADIAAQVSGRVTNIKVTAGEKVKVGQILLTLESTSAQQQAIASEAQIAAANADLELAQKDYQRQEALFKQDYISQAALDRAKTKLEAAKAQARATSSLAKSARAQSDLYVIKAPFSGVIAEIPVNLGDMAMPGKILVSLYDPEHLRVSASVPERAVNKELTVKQLKIEVPSLTQQEHWLNPQTLHLFPTVDSQSHTVLLRINIDRNTADIKPGLFARVWLPTKLSVPNRIVVPLTAIVERGELTGVYVKNEKGEPLLRQVRLGRQWGNEVEVISGLSSTDGLIENAQSLSFKNGQ